MEALPEALLLEQRASFMEDLSRQHLWAYLPQPFCLLWQFLRLQVQWSHDNTSFSSKKYRRAPCHQPDPVRLLLRAPGSATPTPTVHAFFRCTRWLSTFHRGARPTCLHKTELERENAIYPPNLFLFRKKEWERASERERELQWRERVVAHASVGHTSSRSATCLHNLLVYRAGAKELKNAIYSPQLFLLRKKDFERPSMTGESSWKNLNILQASASKLSGFTPRIQPSACGLGLYNARCKTR